MSSNPLYLLALQRCRAFNESSRRLVLERVGVDVTADALRCAGISAAALAALHAELADPQLPRQLEALLNDGVSILGLCDDNYPGLLLEIADPPPVLFVRGRVEALAQPQLAMVGSRRTSVQGRENAFRFARSLAGAGFSIASGLALGIDTDAHRGALAVGGTTVAVLGTGIDVVYPRQNRALLEQILEEGAAVSELPPGAGPLRHHFPRRNRIISGLSLGVLVVEAALKSGSLITARMAMEQGREVFSIPGSIHNPASRGCHELIRQGAVLVEQVDHILDELSGWVSRRSPSPMVDAQPTLSQELSQDLSQEESLLLSTMGYDPVDTDTLLLRCGWSQPDLMATLTLLELNGLVENIAGRYQRNR